MATLGTYASGSTSWINSTNATSVTAYLWGGGGAGGGATGTKSAGGGGAGGAYVVSTINVTFGGTYPVVVGAGGVGGTITGPTGGSSWFGNVGSAYAPGGLGGTRSTGNNLGSQGGAGGTTGAKGTFAYAGGDGGNGVGGTGASALAGGGGGGASETGVGGNASTSTGGTGATTGGGHGGNGGGTAGAIGAQGTALGGGGGGAFSNNTTDRIGGTGALGQVILAWNPNTSPTVTLGTPASGGTVTVGTPQLTFTGTDAEGNAIEYNVQVATGTSFASSGSSVVDSCSNSNQNSNISIYGGAGNTIKAAQSFTGQSGTLKAVVFYLDKTNSPTGNATACIYSHSGDYGTTSVPNTLLATSDNVDVSILNQQPSFSLIPFNFSGTNKIVLDDSTYYCVSFEFSGGNFSNYVNVGDNYGGGNNTTHPGNTSQYVGSWNAYQYEDLCFYVYTDAPGNLLLNKLSVTPDATFTDITNAGSTHPFPSGDNIGYQIQGTDSLANGTYYWRVAGIDPSGANTYGVWSSTRSFTVSMGPVYTQSHYEFFNDDNGLNNASTLGAEDTTVLGQGVGTNFRFRSLVANSSATGTIARLLQWQKSGYSWANVSDDTTKAVYLTPSAVFADGDATSARLTGVGTFVAGQGKETGSATSAGTLTISNCIEDEWNLVFGTAALAGQAYEFRTTNNGTALTTYTKTGTISVYQTPSAYAGFKTLLGVGL